MKHAFIKIMECVTEGNKELVKELEDFLYHVRELNMVRAQGLQVEDTWFEEDGEVTDWLEILDEKWEKENMAMLAFDIDSDSYVIFPCDIEKFEQLEEWAEEEEFRIAYAKDM